MKIKDLFRLMEKRNASDLFLRVKSPPRMRIYSDVVSLDAEAITDEAMSGFLDELLDADKKEIFFREKDIDFSMWIEGQGRFRISVFLQRNTPSMVVRHIREDIFSFEELNLPGDVFSQLCQERRGLILVTGAAGSGKSTTIASMIDYINSIRQAHILTIEEPIEFLFKDKKSIVNQRDLGLDVKDYDTALRQFALQSPDVIYIGTIRDTKTMTSALTAAETGVLVVSTLHTINAYQTVERIINFFPPYQHNQILMQLSLLLKGVISLRLMKRKDKSGMIPAYEIMTLSPTVSRLLREGKIWELARYIQEGEIYGMTTFKRTLLRLVKEDKITPRSALDYADSKEDMLIELKSITEEI